MRWFKKIVRAILALLPVFFFVLIPGRASALKHEYSSLYIPYINYRYACLDNTDLNCGNFSTNPVGTAQLSNLYSVSFPINNPLSRPSLKSQTLLYSNSLSPCDTNASRSSINYSSSSSTTFYTNSFNLSVSNGVNSLCSDYKNTYIYEYDSLKIVPGSGQYATDATQSDIFGSDSHYMYTFSLPISFSPFSSSPAKNYTQGRPYHFHGEFSSSDGMFLSSTSSGSTSSFSNANTVLLVNGVYTSSDGYHHLFNHSYSWDDAGSGRSPGYCQNLYDSADHKRLFWDCYFTLPYDFDYLTFSVTFSRSSSNTPIWYNSSDYVFLTNFYVVTDNDETPGDSINSSINGREISNSPTASATQGDSVLQTLTGLFNFSFTNPFAPIFGLFTDSSQCVNIPTIAGMLGSDNTQYCPWFDSNVRNILTPVLGIAGNMLLFGFIIRWISSRSGNFIEDTGGKD